MLINKFIASEKDTTPYGLFPLSMSRLGRFVAIAGKNGAGKSRLLNLLEISIHGYNSFASNREMLTYRLKEIEDAAGRQPTKPTPWDEEIIGIKRSMEAAKPIETKNGKPLKVLRFVPKNLELIDSHNQTGAQIEEAHDGAANAEVSNFARNTAGYIQHLQNLWWNTSHQNFEGAMELKKNSLDSYNGLCDLTKKLLGEKIERLGNGAASIFGKPIASAGLSDGQRVILQLITAIHAKKTNIDNTVFIMDELENHLHPSVTIEILERLSIAAPQAQIWIATHSIPLLAYIVSQDPMALWYMDQGLVQHAGRRPEKVLESLLGDSERIGQLNAFTGLPAQLAAVNYAVESLMPPQTLGDGKNDPQVSQINKVIAEKFNTFTPEVLDFGAGKGRLLEGIMANRPIGEDAVPISYRALDDSEKDQKQCIAVISEYYDDAELRHFSNEKNFFEKCDDKSLDLIVMCNVLHEIPPGAWQSILTHETSLFQRALKDDGYLLLVEDQRIPVGEKAHEFGFILLDTAQLKTLFGVTFSDISSRLFVSDDFRKDGRLKAHLIGKSILSRMTSASRIKAIKELQKACLDEINKIRKEKPSYMNGQLHGFWTQQFANANIYLSQNE